MTEFGERKAQLLPYETGYLAHQEEEGRARAAELAGDYSPYLNEGFLAQRLASESRILRSRFHLKTGILDTLYDDTDESIVTIVEALAQARRETQPAAGKPVNTILSLATLCRNILLLKEKHLGPGTPHDRDSAICNLLAEQISNEIPDNRVMDYMLSAQFVSDRLQHMARTPISRESPYIQAKVTRLSVLLAARYRGIEFARHYPSVDSREYNPQEIDYDSQTVASMFREIRNSQQTGIKLATKPYDHGGSLIYSTSVIDLMRASAGHANIHPLTISTPAIAEAIFSERRSLRNIKPQPLEVGKVAGMAYDHLSLIGMFFIHGETGELYIDHGCTGSLRDTFVRQGKYEGYRQLQAGVIADYFDMTHRIEVVHGAKQRLRAQETVPGEAPATDDQPLEIFRQLVVPRIRYVTSPDAVGQMAATEGAANTTADEAVEARTVRHHGVIWHSRPLPEGWSASPEAIELAKKAGITLKPGETFVRGYKRGSRRAGEVTGHIIVGREVRPPVE